ncbi:hypothetical protein M8818_002691 [Zalaria obscura]|uniref:Uncharacterized protein n=1 Tax=Zalaria obscura TaxID=2024903 RepID=A0ACC3SGL9_9PEZI
MYIDVQGLVSISPKMEGTALSVPGLTRSESGDLIKTSPRLTMDTDLYKVSLQSKADDQAVLLEKDRELSRPFPRGPATLLGLDATQ